MLSCPLYDVQLYICTLYANIATHGTLHTCTCTWTVGLYTCTVYPCELCTWFWWSFCRSIIRVVLCHAYCVPCSKVNNKVATDAIRVQLHGCSCSRQVMHSLACLYTVYPEPVQVHVCTIPHNMMGTPAVLTDQYQYWTIDSIDRDCCIVLHMYTYVVDSPVTNVRPKFLVILFLLHSLTPSELSTVDPLLHPAMVDQRKKLTKLHPWEQKLTTTQNIIFNKELFAQVTVEEKLVSAFAGWPDPLL